MKAVLISAQRSGGLFLIGCLSNHPDIFAPREEIFKRETIWQQKLKLSHGELLDFILNQPFYKACVTRLTYDQAFNPEIENFIKTQGIKIIHLTRMILPCVTSTLLAKQEMKNGQPRHYFDDSFSDNEILEVDPPEVINRIKHLIKQRRNFKERFGNDHFELQYEEITKHDWILPQELSVELSRFLEIDNMRMFANNRKMHRRPIQSYYSKWNEIEREIERSFPDLIVI